jgi:hypothetical protein
MVCVGLALCVRREIEKRGIYLCVSSLHTMVAQSNEKEKKIDAFFVFI